MRSRFWVTAAMTSTALLGYAASLAGQAAAHPVLVELFTSEGCSSCPPADALLRQIDRMRTDSGQLVVGISEHVTYWNRLGWADPFSAETYTARQEAYRSKLGLDSAYTPQMVVNGSRDVLGSDRGAALRAVQETDHPGSVRLHIVEVKNNGDGVSVRYSVTGGEGQSVDVFAVVADDTATSQVKRGENSGRTLTHVSVARSLTRISSVRGSANETVELPLDGGDSGKRHLVLFAQAAGLGPVLSVDVAALQAKY